MKVNDAIIGGLLAVFGAVIFLYTLTFPGLPGQNFGPALFPQLISIGFIASGVYFVFKGVREHATVPWFDPQPWTRSPRHIANVVFVLVALLFYIFLADTLGFLITGFICLAGLMLWLRGPSRLPSTIVIAVGSVIVIQFAFGTLLRVPLPPGLLLGWGVV
ncbi:tripartite tricarboxylate transporter TctB family protein [Marinivivus vitaminiproducens]|uniref:tripartite tricarboxylate transporter TctB family protein n=1 Tax=Marinivivus vitaminiproducens TaxID=3035935 RepID=UPI00279B955F|nr:tripartite tricarboxylate transporter TctB family protein [Geminicoccaceae bacterium SCSIO 64248]